MRKVQGESYLHYNSANTIFQDMRLLPSVASYFDVSVENTTAQTNVEKLMLSSIIWPKTSNSSDASGRLPASARKTLLSWAQCHLYESLCCIGRDTIVQTNVDPH